MTIPAVACRPLASGEQEILYQISLGKTAGEIANCLGLDESDIHTVIVRLARRFALSNRTQLVIFALRQRLIPEIDHEIVHRVSQGALPPRRLQVVRRIADGWDNSAIAKDLYVGIDSVKIHIKLAAADMGIPARRTLMAAIAFRDRLL
jgi:DNA-binding NarL/FixJ family response regulator